ncbi:hypothetical protein [Paucisalibacillus sp. EB02]|uniref:hypothetical protein n=1 Tax=Paucisalibacillus sp. EB02 TaxID=1347087 RepID=UPI0004B630AB|nr:hypothetical protein [Paucisalibacillus sp. EB02]
MVEVTVSKENHDLNERELKIVEVLLLNLAAHANMIATKGNMMFNPLDKQNHDLFSFQFTWQKSITEETYKEFIETLERRYHTALMMCELEDISIRHQENSYLLKK